jgi:allantoin racemase
LYPLPEFDSDERNMTLKVRIIAPIVLNGPPPGTVEEYVRAAPPGCEVEVVFLDRGPASIESEFEEALAAPDVVAQARAAEVQGADAVVVSCMLDPGVPAAREQVSIPVFGPAQVSMHIAAMLGHHFSIITVLARLIPPIRRLARLYGLSDHLASVRAINVPVLQLKQNQTQVVEALVHESMHALSNDGACAIILGCTGMAGMAQAVREQLLQLGYDVPVIDPTITTIKMVPAFVSTGLKHSKLAYPFPPEKLIRGYPTG